MNEPLYIAYINLGITAILCIFAGYSAFISRKVSEAALQELRLKTRPLLTSKVDSANFVSDGELVITMALANKGSTEVLLSSTDIYLIDLPKFKNDGEVLCIKSSNIDYESMFIGPNSETTYDFTIDKEAFEKMQSGDIGIFSTTVYSNIEGTARKLNVVSHYGKVRNSIASYKIWHDRHIT